MPDVTVHTLKHDITIRTGGEAEFMYLTGSPEVATDLAPASIEIQREGTFLSASWRGLAPSFLTRVASARDLVLQLDNELAELSLRDAEPGMLLSASLVHWRGKRLLLLGPALARTALVLALFRWDVDIEGDWVCQLSPSGLMALPRSVRWGLRLGRSYPEAMEITADIPSYRVDSFHGEIRAWCPMTEERRWFCRNGGVDGTVVTDDMAGGCSLARRLAPDLTWGHLMSSRVTGDGSLPTIMALKGLGAAAPAIRLSVGELAGATDIVMQFLAMME